MTIHEKILTYYREEVGQNLEFFSQIGEGAVFMSMYIPRLMGENFVRATIEIGNIFDDGEITSVIITHEDDHTNVVFRNNSMPYLSYGDRGMLMDSMSNLGSKTFYAQIGNRVWRKGITCSLQQYERYQGLVDAPGYDWIIPRPSYPYKSSFINRFNEMGLKWWISSRDLGVYVEEPDLMELRMSL